MSQENKDIVRRCWEECFNKGNLNVVDQLVAPSYVWHGPGMEVHGREGVKQVINTYRTAFPDIRMTYQDQIAEGDKVASRWTVHGTHRGDLMGTPPTNKPMTLSGMVLSRLVKGQIVEEWEVFDQLGMMQQLGLIPAQQTTA